MLSLNQGRENNKNMITASQARSLSQRCEEYIDKLAHYEEHIENLIKDTTMTGRTIAEYSFPSDSDKFSLIHDLKKILIDNGYQIQEKQSPREHVLMISW